MPLINFKTDFTSLRYGNDRPNGGSSTQPYVQFPIPGVNPPPVSNDALAFFNSYYETNRTSLDFPIRGGRVVEGAPLRDTRVVLIGGNRYSTPSNEIDRVRIQNFLKDAPRGPIFIEKQRGLQLSNPNTQVANAFQVAGFSFDNAILPITRVYNPANTIAQVAAQGTGAHYNRQGTNPTIYQAPQSTYEYVVANSNTPDQNRLTVLAQVKLRSLESGGALSDFLFDIRNATLGGIDFQTYNNLNISPLQNQIFSYTGGPGSTYGIGGTIIRRATSTVPAKAYSKIAFTYDQIATQETRAGNDPLVVQMQDFRDQLDPTKVARSSYPGLSMQNRLGIGNPGDNTFPRVKYNNVNESAIDTLNRKGLYYYTSPKGSSQNAWSVGGSDVNDLIKFGFECIDNDNPDNVMAIMFRAFLDGAIQDTNTAEFGSFKYLGRGETFRTYQGFERSVSFAFKILVQTRSEMRPLYKKLNHLISQTYPDYSPVSRFMRGSVVRLTIGDYFYRVPGFLDSVNVTLNTDVGWEILLNQYDEDDVFQAPFVVDVSCGFKPIMDILPRRESYKNPFVPLIANRDNLMSVGIEDYSTSTVADPLQQAAQQAITQPAVGSEIPKTATPQEASIIQNNNTQVPQNGIKNKKGKNPPKVNEGGGNPQQARNPNAVVYQNGLPMLNPYGYLGGKNGTTKYAKGYWVPD